MSLPMSGLGSARNVNGTIGLPGRYGVRYANASCRLRRVLKTNSAQKVTGN